MALSVKIFNGKLNKDTHPYRVPQGDYIDALNITRDAEGDGQDDVVSNVRGNTVVSYIPTGNIRYGLNGNIAFSAESYSNFAFRNAINEIPPQVVRYPGGQISNDFNWQTGKRDDGTGKANLLADNKSLVDTTGCDILFCLNMITKTLANQLTMLAAADALGIPIKYVELGNEYNNTGNSGHITFPTPSAYFNEAAIWMAAIKAAYPDVKVAVIGGNRTWSVEAMNWNGYAAAINPDAIVWHCYADPDIFAPGGAADMILLDQVISDDFEEDGMNEVSIPIWVTEYNWKYNDHDGTNNLLPEWQEPVTLFITQKITSLIGSSVGVKLMCANNIVGKEGAVDDVTFELLPTGLALQEFLSTFTTGINKVIGGYECLLRNRYYFFVWNSDGFHTIVYYDGTESTTVKLLENLTDSDGEDILNFNPSEKIHSVNIIYADDGDILSFVDSIKRPSQINVDKALSGFYGTWQRTFLDVAKEPPSLPPKCIFEDDATVTVNNFKKRLFKFRHRFEFENHEKSVYSPESEIPLPYNIGDPDLDTDPQLNARISIILETGGLNVRKIELVGAVSLGNTFSDYFLIDTLDKSELGLQNNNTTIYKFFNDKQYPTVDITEILQPYDYVPKKANTQEQANGNTREYAGITEGYDRIEIDAHVTTALDDDTAFQYPKSLLFASQTNKGVKIIVLGKIQENDVFNIYTTNEAFQYVANAGDVTADVIHGLRDAAIAIGFTVVLTNDNTWIILDKAGETFELFLEIPDTPADFSDVTPAYDWLSKNSFGLHYQDEKGRDIGGVLTGDFLSASMPVNGVVNRLPYVDLTIDHRPPIDAKTFQWVRSKDIAKSRILQWITDRAFKDDKYAYVSIAALNQYILDNPSTATQLGYTFVPGDRIRFMQFIWNGVPQVNYGNVLDFEILASLQNPIIGGIQQQGQILKIALPVSTIGANFDFGNIQITVGIFKDFENYFVEIYTPSKPIGDNLNVYYEFGEKYDILDAGTEDRRHQGQLQNQSEDLLDSAYFRFKKGDYYYRLRDISTGNTLQFTLLPGELDFSDATIDILGSTLTSSTYNTREYNAQSSEIQFAFSPLSDSGNWFIEEIDGLARTFHIKGALIVQAANLSTFSFEVDIVATNGAATSVTNLYTSTSSINPDDIFTIYVDADFTIPSGYGKTYLIIYTTDTGWNAKILSGSLTLTEPSKTFATNIIDQNFSDFFLSSVNSNGRAWAIEPNAKEEYNPVKIRFSQEFDQDTNTNGLNRFYEDNFVEIDRGGADIQRLFVDGRRLYAFQKFNVGVIPILTQIVKDVTGNPLEANSDLLLNKVSYPFSGKYGIGDAPCSLTYGKGNFFFIDTNKKVVCMIPNGGDIVPISILFEMTSFFILNLSAYNKGLNNGYAPVGEVYTGDANIYGQFNEYTNRYILALEEINRYDVDGNLLFHQDAYTLSFSFTDKTKGFESFLSYAPEWMGNLGTLLISFKSGGTWIHNSSTYCNFYGIQYSAYIVAAFNDNALQKKSWIGLTETASEVWDCPEIATQVNTYGSTPQSSKLPAARFTLQEGEWCASFLRDINSYGGLINGGYLKGNYMIIKFIKENAANFIFLNAVGVKYNVSKLVAV